METSDADGAGRVRLAWIVHPAKERPRAAVAAVAAIAAVAALVYLTLRTSIGGFNPVGVAESTGWAVFSGLVLILSLNRFFFPSRFEIREEGIEARYLMRRQSVRWRDVRRMEAGRRGAYLSTRSRRSRWDAFSGVHIWFGGNGPEVRALIEAYLSRTLDGQGGSARESEG